MGNRRLISYILFVLAVVLFLVLGLAGDNWLVGLLVGLLAVVVGIFFFRRGG